LEIDFDVTQLIAERKLVHLLLCRLQQRRFYCREPACPGALLDLWQRARMAEVEEALWGVRVKLAAALARLRIQSHALKLEHLLPHALRDRKDCATSMPSTFWINTCKIRCVMTLSCWDKIFLKTFFMMQNKE
jgi:hypothetical protein